MNKKTSFLIELLLVVSTFLSISFDIYPYRQVLGSFTYSFLFGYLFISIIGVKNIKRYQLLIYSVGISISFLMIFGYLINTIYYSFGYSTPLSILSLSLSINIVLIFMSILRYFQKESAEPKKIILKSTLNKVEKVILILSSLIFPLGIYSTLFMETTGNNIYILSLYLLIIILVLIISIFHTRVQNKNYPILIYVISFSLVWGYALRCNYVMGDDEVYSYYLYKYILSYLHWSILEPTPLNGCLSVTLLPTIYSSLLNVSGHLIFKILYPILFSLIPLIVYELARKYVNHVYAFLASFFFMIQYSFLKTIYEARTGTAIFFFALSILIFFEDDIELYKKKILFFLFSFSVIISHYSTAYIYFFILVGIYILTHVFDQILASRSKAHHNKMVFSLPLIFFIEIFVWFSQVVGSSFNSGIRFITKTIAELNSMFLLESHSSEVSSIIGLGIEEKGIPHIIQFVLTWIIFIMIGIGTLYIIYHFVTNQINPNNTPKDNLVTNMDTTYLSLILCCLFLLFIFVALPFVSEGYGMQRVYYQTSVVLSLVFVMGVISVSKVIKISPIIILLLIGIPYFLSITGVTYELAGHPRELILNSKIDSYDTYYIYESEYASGKWYTSHSSKNIPICTDSNGYLTSTVGSRIRSGEPAFYTEYIPYFYNIALFPRDGFKSWHGYIYLRYANIIERKSAYKNQYTDFSVEYLQIQKYADKIYSTNCAEIYLAA